MGIRNLSARLALAVASTAASAQAPAPHPRNLSDEMLRAVADNGGVVMINFAVSYLDSRKTSAWKIAKDWVVTAGGSITSVSDVADHVDHVVRVAGIDHVGLGSDFDGTPLLPEGLGHVGELPHLTEERLRRGYTESDLRKVLGENLLRVLEQAESAAGPSRSPAPRVSGAAPRWSAAGRGRR